MTGPWDLMPGLPRTYETASRPTPLRSYWGYPVTQKSFVLRLERLHKDCGGLLFYISDDNGYGGDSCSFCGADDYPQPERH